MAQWPINRKFADKKSRVKFPVEEVKWKYRNRLDTAGELLIGAAVGVPDADAGGPGCAENHVLLHFGHGWLTNSWDRLVTVTSFMFQWMAKM